jgi:hypothetical protein
MNRNLVGSIYGRYSLPIAHFVPNIYKHGHDRQCFFLVYLTGEWHRLDWASSWHCTCICVTFFTLYMYLCDIFCIVHVFVWHFLHCTCICVTFFTLYMYLCDIFYIVHVFVWHFFTLYMYLCDIFCIVHVFVWHFLHCTCICDIFYIVHVFVW